MMLFLWNNYLFHAFCKDEDGRFKNKLSFKKRDKAFAGGRQRMCYKSLYIKD